MMNYYSHKIITLFIGTKHSLFTLVGYKYISTFLNSSLKELTIIDCLNEELGIITHSLTKLEKLKLDYSFLDSNALATIAKLINLQTLHLLNMLLLNDDAVVDFTSLTALNELFIDHCPLLTGTGLSQMISSRPVISLLVCNCTGIFAEGFHCLSTLSNLKKLYLGFCNFDNFCLVSVCTHCILIERLSIEVGTLITIEGLSNINNLRYLKFLVISAKSDEWLLVLSRNTSLTELDLDGSDITDLGLKHLFKLTNLTKLELNRCQEISEVGVKELEMKMSRLTHLGLHGCYF
jgi:hypothetical protein